MNTYAKLAAAAAAVLVIAVVGYRFLPGPSGVGGQPTVAPSPSLGVLARGTFVVVGNLDTTLDATGSGSNVDGSMRVKDTSTSQEFTVDLQCERTTDGMTWIGGDVTASSYDSVPKGTRAAIVLQPGEPVEAIFVFQGEDPPSASCLAFFDDMVALGSIKDAVEPIRGTVDLHP